MRHYSGHIVCLRTMLLLQMGFVVVDFVVVAKVRTMFAVGHPGLCENRDIIIIIIRKKMKY